ncbi:MAG: box helicase [Chitinophagaceae bacterium]|nr:box helicase [Chitinophagaceae bacterium]
MAAPILKALQSQGYTHPTPIQQQAIPVALDGRDILACAQTGTGKTAAFAIPILQVLAERKAAGARGGIKALILTPTRELAIQIEESFSDYGQHINLTHTAIFGGVPQYHQVNKLRRGIDILIATPGRLLDLISQRHVSLQDVETFVLDEADRMLDMGFINDVKKVIAKLPEEKQTLFFSATMPPDVQRLSQMLLHQPVRIEVTPVSSTVEKIDQAVYFVEKQNKVSLLLHVLEDKAIENVLIFTQTKHGADKLCKQLIRSNIQAQAIHGNKSQNARQLALENFKKKQIRVLVATDIAARGIDIDKLGHVVNYDIPNIPETYVHRIGRTGRAGEDGKAISFCAMEEKMFLRDVQKLTGQTIAVVSEHPFPMSNPGLAIPPRPTMPHSALRSGGSRKGRTFRQR